MPDKEPDIVHHHSVVAEPADSHDFAARLHDQPAGMESQGGGTFAGLGAGQFPSAGGQAPWQQPPTITPELYGMPQAFTPDPATAQFADSGFTATQFGQQPPQPAHAGMGLQDEGTFAGMGAGQFPSPGGQAPWQQPPTLTPELYGTPQAFASDPATAQFADPGFAASQSAGAPPSYTGQGQSPMAGSAPEQQFGPTDLGGMAGFPPGDATAQAQHADGGASPTASEGRRVHFADQAASQDGTPSPTASSAASNENEGAGTPPATQEQQGPGAGEEQQRAAQGAQNQQQGGNPGPDPESMPEPAKSKGLFGKLADVVSNVVEAVVETVKSVGRAVGLVSPEAPEPSASGRPITPGGANDPRSQAPQGPEVDPSAPHIQATRQHVASQQPGMGLGGPQHGAGASAGADAQGQGGPQM